MHKLVSVWFICAKISRTKRDIMLQVYIYGVSEKNAPTLMIVSSTRVDEISALLVQSIRTLPKNVSKFNFTCTFMLSCIIKHDQQQFKLLRVFLGN